MALKRRARPEAEVFVSSFADIAFLLIIFFILTTTLSKPAGSELQIPSGVQDKSADMGKTPTVNLSATGITWGDRSQKINLDELRVMLLRQNLRARPEGKRIVILNSAAEVPYERYFQVVMAIDNADGILALVESEEKEQGK